MRIRSIASLAVLGAIVALGPDLVAGQDNRDFVFADEEGHRVLRFVGVGAGEMTEYQIDEVANAEFSTMVHDRIRADLLFEVEPIESTWADPTELRVRQHLDHRSGEFISTAVECRSASCRIVLEHAGGEVISQQRSIMEEVQRVLEEFVADSKPAFEKVFLITAYYQVGETPHIKAFLQRSN